MNEKELEVLARHFAQTMEGWCPDPAAQRLSMALPEMLLGGIPLTAEQIAAHLDWPREKVLEGLANLSDVELDDEGRVVGSGITLRPTPHRFTVDGQQLYTWCAWDSLTFPPLFNRTAQVESACAATGSSIRMTVTPHGVEELVPADAVVSLVTAGACCAGGSIRSSFCNHVHFIRSAAHAEPFLASNSAPHLLPVSQAFELGHRIHRILKGTFASPSGRDVVK